MNIANRHALFDTVSASSLNDLIQAHKAAKQAFHNAIDQEWEMEEAYFAAHPREIVIPLAIGGGVAFYVRADLDECADDCQSAILQNYVRQHGCLDGVERIAPDIAKQARSALDKKFKADIRVLKRHYREEQARRDAFGYGGALRAKAAADDAERDALQRVCAYRCRTPEEFGVKGQYLFSLIERQRDELPPELVECLLESMITQQV